MRNLTERPDPLNESRGFYRTLPLMAGGPRLLRHTGRWKTAVWLSLAAVAISTGVRWSSTDRPLAGDGANQHLIAQPPAEETGCFGLSTHEPRFSPQPALTTHIKRRRPSRRRPELTRMVAEGSERHLSRFPIPRLTTVRASTANLAFQVFRGLHHTERAGITSSWSASAPPTPES